MANRAHPDHLIYSKPADAWHDALPLGNGRLGAMVYGHTGIERVQLNDDSLWYGTFYDRNNPSLREALPKIRDCILRGDIYHAEEYLMQNAIGAPAGMRHYSTLGELDIALNRHLPFTMGWLPDSSDATDYKLDLDLITGVLSVDHTQDGVRYHREMFISHPAQVLCYRIVSETPGAINLDILMNRISLSDAVTLDDRRPGRRVSNAGWPAPNADSIRTADDCTLLMQGHDAEVGFAAAARIICDGELINVSSQLLARHCSEALILVASSTSNRTPDPARAVLARLENAAKVSYPELKKAHTADFAALMNRCSLDLGPAPHGPIDERLQAVRDGADDPALAALYFQFGRYLIVAGSREDSSALNLQGIWNADFMPMWDSKYTVNINLQMNYWPVEVTGLSELHGPLMDLLEIMRDKGRETARTMYGMRGMVCHHNTDYYGDCAPQDTYMAATSWVTGGPWLGLHIWEHYRYTQDLAFLRRMYPVMRDLALFFVDFLIDVDGQFLTCPSVSPENRYLMPDGYDTPICAAPAMDNQILRAFFAACVETQRLLDEDADLAATLRRLSDGLPKDRIGSKGQLLEWREEYPELTPGMDHISHLFACYPGQAINWLQTPDLMQAVNRSLELRVENGAGRGGWPLAWYISIYARLLDGAKAGAAIRKMLARSAARNLLNANYVFQIDGNLGAVAGIAECLLQSHLALHFLPALPPEWLEGHVSGLRARGGATVDLQWHGGRLAAAVVHVKFDGPVEIVGETLRVRCNGQDVPSVRTQTGFSFAGEADRVYSLEPCPGQ
jgi:alpha-L-fucosidase 2